MVATTRTSSPSLLDGGAVRSQRRIHQHSHDLLRQVEETKQTIQVRREVFGHGGGRIAGVGGLRVSELQLVQLVGLLVEVEALALFPRSDDARAAVVTNCGCHAYALCLYAATATTNDPLTTINVVPNKDQTAVARVAELTLRCRAQWWMEDNETKKETDHVIVA